MAQSNQNDIVITAQAGTKQAEANVQQLEAKIKSLTAHDSKLKQFGRDLLGVSNDAQAATKSMNVGFASLQGSFNSVITQLGAVGLAVGALKVAWDTAQKEQQRYIDSLQGQADAAGKHYSTMRDSTKGILDNLEKLDQLANDGYLDDNAIQQTNSLVAQLNDLWGDVGLSVDQTTGKVNGLKDATQKINAELKAMALQQLELEEKVAQAEYDKAQADYSWWYDENGKLQNEAMGMFIAGNWTGSGDNYKAELDNKRKTAQAALIGIQARKKLLEGNTTQEEINDTIAKAEAAKAEEEAANKAKVDLDNKITDTKGKFQQVDYTEKELRYNLAVAQANGGDVEAAKNELNDYLRKRDLSRFNELEQQIKKDVHNQAEAQKKFDQAEANGATGEELLSAAEALNEAQKQLLDHTKELEQLGSRLEQPIIEEPKTEVAAIVKEVTNGTFNAYGLNGLAQNPIEQQQLEVQKQIAKNTENLNVPIVGE